MFEIGDTVALSGPLIMQLATDHPPVFEYLREARRHGGQVTAVDGNSVSIDIGMDRPIIVDLDPESPNQLLQLIRRADNTDATCMPTSEEVVEANHSAEPVPSHINSVLGGDMPSAMQQMMQQLAHGRMVPLTAIMQPPQQHPEPPGFVRVAQWVIQHFTEMKKFVITQDINDGQRRAATKAHRLPGDLDEVFDTDRVPIRAGLSAAETKLYEEALGNMGDWMHTLKNAANPVAQTAVTPLKPPGTCVD